MGAKEQAAIRKARFKSTHRAQGLCIECTNAVENGHIRCDRCRARRRANHTRDLSLAIKTGKCAECSGKALEGHRSCQKCYLKGAATRHLGTRTRWQEILTLFEAQQGRCALSGRPLVLGVNADLDHIVPRSRGGSNDLSNLQWVLASINAAKSNMTEDEFFALVKDVYLHMKKGKAGIP